MKLTQRTRRAGAAAAMAILIGGGGVAAGAAITGAGNPQAAPSVPAPVSVPAPASYADVVRQVLPSVVLIRTANGLGSGVVLDDEGNIVTNAHVAGDATTFEVQLAGDPSRARPAGRQLPAGDGGDPGRRPVRLARPVRRLGQGPVGDAGAGRSATRSDCPAASPQGIVSRGRAGGDRARGRFAGAVLPTRSRPARRSTPATAAARW